MPLTPEQIKALLNKPAPKRTSKAKKTVDTSKRDYQTWFKLAHHLFDINTGERAKCSNPDCADTRHREATITVEVDGVHMCRICFLAGYMLSPGDGQLATEPTNPSPSPTS